MNLNSKIEEIIIHTGQHYDPNMSSIFFEQMGIPKPNYMLEINRLSHGAMTGRMIEEIESILIRHKPDYVMVYGDTNSTLAGAIAASKLGIKIVHVESGLRSYNNAMPEEINRVLTDRVSSILYCPSEDSKNNLINEATLKGAYVKVTGDVMYDTVRTFMSKRVKPQFTIPENFVLVTIHRQENTMDKERLELFISSLNEIGRHNKIIFPLHPRTKVAFEKLSIKPSSKICFVPPVGYLEMLYLIYNCTCIITDSGGLQKEAYFAKKFCLTFRPETEWKELLAHKVNFLVNSRAEIIDAFESIRRKDYPDIDNIYGNGRSAEIIVKDLSDYHRNHV